MGTSPDFLVVGHVTQDLQADGTFRLGGTAFYAAVTVARLGYQVAVYTAAGPDLDLAPLGQAADGAMVLCRPAPATTAFYNRYEGGRRRQFLLSRATTLTPEDLPSDWCSVPLILLGPVAQEVPPAWVACFPQATVGACLQGWLRTWDRSGRVRFRRWQEADHWLPHFAAAFVSTEDVRGRRSLVEAYAAHCRLLVLTKGAQGATLYGEGRSSPVAAFSVREVDPTGAGDVFAAAFLVRYAEGASPMEAARFAAGAAALSVQGCGSQTIPQRSAVEALLREAGDVVAAS